MVPRVVAAPLVREGCSSRSLGDRPGFSRAPFLVFPWRGQVPRKVKAFGDFPVEWLEKSPVA
jgi:hypothetical protein